MLQIVCCFFGFLNHFLLLLFFILFLKLVDRYLAGWKWEIWLIFVHVELKRDFVLVWWVDSPDCNISSLTVIVQTICEKRAGEKFAWKKEDKCRWNCMYSQCNFGFLSIILAQTDIF